MRMIIAVLGVLLTFGTAEVSAAPFSVTLATDGIPSDFAVTSDGTRVVVGGSSLDNPTPRIWVYSPSGELEVVDVAMPANVSAAGATSISPNGRYVAITASEMGQFRAFVYDRDTGTVDRRGPSASGPTSDATFGYAVDDTGNLYGSVRSEPAIFDQSGVTNLLFSPRGGASTIWETGNGISVGHAADFTLELQAAMWDAAGTYTDLSFGASTSIARGISENGNLVVGHRDGQMTYWDLLGGSYTTLDFYGELMGTTDSGFMWGYGFEGESEVPIVYALGWSEPLNFNDWMADLGVSSETSVLAIAGCVDRGATNDCAYYGSAGLALNLPNPTFRGEAPVPEPTTLTLLGLGLLGVASRFRRRVG